MNLKKLKRNLRQLIKKNCLTFFTRKIKRKTKYFTKTIKNIK